MVSFYSYKGTPLAGFDDHGWGTSGVLNYRRGRILVRYPLRPGNGMCSHSRGSIFLLVLPSFIAFLGHNHFLIDNFLSNPTPDFLCHAHITTRELKVCTLIPHSRPTTLNELLRTLTPFSIFLKKPPSVRHSFIRTPLASSNIMNPFLYLDSNSKPMHCARCEPQHPLHAPAMVVPPSTHSQSAARSMEPLRTKAISRRLTNTTKRAAIISHFLAYDA